LSPQYLSSDSGRQTNTLLYYWHILVDPSLFRHSLEYCRGWLNIWHGWINVLSISFLWFLYTSSSSSTFFFEWENKRFITSPGHKWHLHFYLAQYHHCHTSCCVYLFFHFLLDFIIILASLTNSVFIICGNLIISLSTFSFKLVGCDYHFLIILIFIIIFVLGEFTLSTERVWAWSCQCQYKS